jgi:hypothetical protein
MVVSKVVAALVVIRLSVAIVGKGVGAVVGRGVGGFVVCASLRMTPCGGGIICCSGIERKGSGFVAEFNKTNCVEMLALAGTVPLLMEFTVICKLSPVLVKFGIITNPPALSFTCFTDPFPMEYVVTST